jgi:hypothetical protein
MANARNGMPIQRGFEISSATLLGYMICCETGGTECGPSEQSKNERNKRQAQTKGKSYTFLLAGCLRYNTAMSQAASAITHSPAEVVQNNPVSQAPNGICYARSGEITIAENDLDRMVAAVPVPVAAALDRKAYYFVPLTVTQGEDTVIADRYDVALSDNAVCHRNLNLGDAQCVFISTRLMEDKFSVAFEFYINVGHALVERAGVSQNFAELAWQQVESGVRGETSLDAWESRKFATAHGPDAEKFKNEYLAAAFADSISIYLLALYLDVDYYDLRERDYPLLAPAAMAERLRKVAEIFPPNSGFDFNIYYRRRSEAR